MARPTSFRLPDELMSRIEAMAASEGQSMSGLVSSLLDEGVKTRRFAGIVYRDGPTGRRAGVAGGPDVWEIIRDLQRASGREEQRIRRVAHETGLAPALIRLAIDFYVAFPDEIDERMVVDQRTADRQRELVDRRQRLLS
ncbi:MAG: ribbon-helix-helix protein, CopG family [Actinomycetota bacterium]